MAIDMITPNQYIPLAETKLQLFVPNMASFSNPQQTTPTEDAAAQNVLSLKEENLQGLH